MITTIFLDLDDTLFSFQQAEQVALEETMRHYRSEERRVGKECRL